MTTFASLGIAAPIQTALAEYGYETPTVIQEKAIPAGIAGRDVLGSAQTGTGKTCAFGVPILQRLAAQGHGKPIRALILTPTRELAIQIDDNLHAYGKHLPLTEAVIFGGVGQAPQVEKLKRGVDILTATPGRLLDLAGQGLLDLSQVEIFVLDEADRMLDMGFIHDVRKVIKLLPEKKQTTFFSATLPPEILDLVDTLLHDPVKVAAAPISTPVEVIRQEVCLVDRKNKTDLLLEILQQENVSSALVFTRTKHGADKVARDLTRKGVTAAAIHGNRRACGSSSPGSCGSWSPRTSLPVAWTSRTCPMSSTITSPRSPKPISIGSAGRAAQGRGARPSPSAITASCPCSKTLRSC